MSNFRQEEHGFTLVEVLVATLLMLMVLMALYALFDMSVRVFGIGNSEIETNEQARLALERMEREIRNTVCDTSICTISGTASEVSLKTQTGYATTSEIRYYVCNGTQYGCGSSNTGNLMRIKSGVSPGESLADMGNNGILSLKYCEAPDSCNTSSNSSMRMVDIMLVITDEDQSQTLNTIAGLRNR